MVKATRLGNKAVLILVVGKSASFGAKKPLPFEQSGTLQEVLNQATNPLQSAGGSASQKRGFRGSARESALLHTCLKSMEENHFPSTSPSTLHSVSGRVSQITFLGTFGRNHSSFQVADRNHHQTIFPVESEGLLQLKWNPSENPHEGFPDSPDHH